MKQQEKPSAKKANITISSLSYDELREALEPYKAHFTATGHSNPSGFHSHLSALLYLVNEKGKLGRFLWNRDRLSKEMETEKKQLEAKFRDDVTFILQILGLQIDHTNFLGMFASKEQIAEFDKIRKTAAAR